MGIEEALTAARVEEDAQVRQRCMWELLPTHGSPFVLCAPDGVSVAAVGTDCDDAIHCRSRSGDSWRAAMTLTSQTCERAWRLAR